MDQIAKQLSLEIIISKVSGVTPHPTAPKSHCNILDENGDGYAVSLTKQAMIEELKKPDSRVLIIKEGGMCTYVGCIKEGHYEHTPLGTP